MKRILTGDNPTGELHIGHYVGSLENRVKLQHEYETFIILADMHAFAYPKYVSNPEAVHESVLHILAGNLAVGLDPDKVTFFVESSIPEIYEFAIVLSMLTSHNRAIRNPTLKDEIREKNMGDTFSLGFVNFPTLQSADILCVKADLVPVGEDQLPHVELARETARKFNQTYNREVFKEPEALVGKVRRLAGLDGGTKMSKSLGNTIYLNETRDELKRKVMSMYTDPTRIHASDPGRVQGNPVFLYHDIFNENKEEVADFKARYTKGAIGDVEVKTRLFEVLDNFLTPIREKYNEINSQPEKLIEILRFGNQRTRDIAKRTLVEAKEAMQFHDL